MHECNTKEIYKRKTIQYEDITELFPSNEGMKQVILFTNVFFFNSFSLLSVHRRNFGKSKLIYTL